MILKLLKNGEYKEVAAHNAQYEYYYYEYNPEKNAVVIFLETGPDDSFNRYTTKAQKIEQMAAQLIEELQRLGFDTRELNLNADDNSLLIIRNSLFKMMLYRQDKQYKNKDLDEAMDVIDLLATLNLNIHTDFLPQFEVIVENSDKDFNFKIEEVENEKSYIFNVKNKGSARLQANLAKLLRNKIINLVGVEIGTEETVKLSNSSEGAAVTISQAVFDKIQQINIEFKLKLNPSVSSDQSVEYAIRKADSATRLFEEKIFNKPVIKYEEKKQHLSFIVDTFKQLTDIDEAIKLYDVIKGRHDKVDIHRHWLSDKLFGKKYSTSWQNAMKEIRKHALLLLDKKLVDCRDNIEAKKKVIEQYNKSPIFTDHRSNNPFRLFYRPNILKRLDLTLEKYNKQMLNSANKAR